ncbi:SLBB domain-containing protein [Tistrella mobilis]|uniref:SLBB domain-containing protein n=1 Tax=Tistrella mobilis TaxID=171437 RepID=UPI0031F6E67F
MIFDIDSLREILRVRSGPTIRRFASMMLVAAVGGAAIASVGGARGQTLLDLQGQIESATQALQNNSNTQLQDGSANTSLDAQAESRSATEDGADDADLQAADSDLGLGGPSSASGGKPSSIERDYAMRTGRALRQYGYRVFDRAAPTPITSGEISPDYVLGIGDELIVTYRGQISRTVSVRVNRDGDVVLPETPPLKAVGATLADLRDRLQRITAESMVGSRVYVTVGNVRLVSVTVLGEVGHPGARSLNSFATVVDAIGAAGGVRRSGSLRRIELIRINGERIFIDLYDYLRGDYGAASASLRDGDRIVVPLLGPTVAVDGDVARPAIFETAPGSSSMTVKEALDLSGGALRPAGNRFIRITFDPDGVQSAVSADLKSGSLRRGEILQVFIDRNVIGGTVFVEGSVSTPGPRALDKSGSLRAVLANLDLLSGAPYLPFGAVLTRDPLTLLPIFTPFDPLAVINGRQDMKLNSTDRVIIFGAKDISFLSTPAVADALSSRGGACPALSALSGLVRRSRADSFLSARQFLIQGGIPASATSNVDCPAIYDLYPNLMSLLLENVSAVTGDVRNPGLYPIAQPVSLRILLNAAGGLGRSADISQVEVSRYDAKVSATSTEIQRQVLDLTQVSLDSVMIRPGDTVRVATRVTTREQGLVTVRGEVLRPGAYDISRGDRLSDVLARAGGLTSAAYPFGAVFTRDRVRDLERQANRRTAAELQKGIVSLLARQSQRSTTGAGVADAMGVMRDLVKDLAAVEPYGRVVVEADPAVLAARPELDTVLEGGDEVTIPKRPNYILVVGEVLNPGAQQFRSGLHAAEYVDAAGGYAVDSDEGRAFVVLPNGAAEPINLGSWSTEEANIPPGAMIVVPRDLAPFDFLAITSDVTRILSSVALTAAALNAVQN